MGVSVTVHVIVSNVASVIDQDLDRRQSKSLVETISGSLSGSQVTSLAATLDILKGAFQQLCCFSECNISPHIRESVFWNPGNFCLWNTESWAVEYGTQLKESAIPLRIIGTRNPSSTDKESRIHRLSWIPLHGEKHFFFILDHILDLLNVICKVLRCPFPRVVHHLSTTGSPHTYLPISIYTDYWISTLGGLFCL